MPSDKQYPDKPQSVYFFGTCLIDLLYPEAGLAGMELIQREGVKVIFPQDQTCCGQPAWNSGYRDEARRVAMQQIRAFPGEIPIVVPSGSCAGMMRQHYATLFDDSSAQARARAFSSRVFELTEFLVHVLKIDLKDLGPPVRVTLHTACSARREMEVAGEHETLLRQLENVEVLEMERAGECCGFGGTFAIKHPEISAAMVADKGQAVRETGAERLISGDCGCLLNITGHLAASGGGPDGQHIASFLWERTRAAAR